MNERERISESKAVRDPFQDEAESLARGQHSDPFQVLGPHLDSRWGKSVLAIRAFHPVAVEAAIVGTASGATYMAEKIHPEGLFEANLPPGSLPSRDGQLVDPASYQWRLRFADGNVLDTHDPYAFPPF